MLLPTDIPQRLAVVAFGLMPASISAASAATSANCVGRVACFKILWSEIIADGSKFFTSAAIFVVKPLASNNCIGAIPLCFSVSAFQVDGMSSPSGVIMPMPVMATLICFFILQPVLVMRRIPPLLHKFFCHLLHCENL